MTTTARTVLVAATIFMVSGCGWDTLAFSIGGEDDWSAPSPLVDSGGRTEFGLSLWRDEFPVNIGVSVYGGDEGSEIVTAHVQGGIGLPLLDPVEGNFTPGLALTATLGGWSWRGSPEHAGLLTGIGVMLVLGWENDAGEGTGLGFSALRNRAVMLEYGSLWLNGAVGDSDAEMRRWRISYVHQF